MQGRASVLPGKPPSVPTGLLGQADGRKSPSAIRQGDGVGCARREPGNLIIKKPSWLSGGI